MNLEDRLTFGCPNRHIEDGPLEADGVNHENHSDRVSRVHTRNAQSQP